MVPYIFYHDLYILMLNVRKIFRISCTYHTLMLLNLHILHVCINYNLYLLYYNKNKNKQLSSVLIKKIFIQVCLTRLLSIHSCNIKHYFYIICSLGHFKIIRQTCCLAKLHVLNKVLSFSADWVSNLWTITSDG